MFNFSLSISLLLIIFVFKQIYSNELTFELPDNAKECFNEKLKVGAKICLRISGK